MAWEVAYHSNRPGVAEQNPELNQGQGTHPGNGEEANPFDADCYAQTEACHRKPEPPTQLECLLRPLLMLVRERVEGQCCERGPNH